MRILCWLILITAAYPLWRAWHANRRTSLIQAVHWAIIAWAAWGVAVAMAGGASTVGVAAGSYLALCLTGCAGIAVLGARRPGVTAWNFVVVALLAVNLLPLAEGLLAAKALHLDTFRMIGVATTIVVGVLNYLPTRLAPASILILFGSGFVFLTVLDPVGLDGKEKLLLRLGWLALACVPWLAYWSIRSQARPTSEFDRIWLDYRNRFGFTWAQRLRDQFNRAAAHAGWQVILRWQGLRLVQGTAMPEDDVQQEMIVTLRALMKRFGREGEGTPTNHIADHAEAGQPQNKL